MAQILEGRQTEWTAMARQPITASLRVGPHKKTRRSWDPTEALLLALDLKVLHSLTLQGMLQGLAAACTKLDSDFHDQSISCSASLD